MQHSANSNNKNGGNAQVQSVIIIAITLFALAGAILGFSLGALTHHSASTTNTANSSSNKNTKPVQTATKKTPVPSATAAAAAVQLGCPLPNLSTPLSSNFTYTFTLQVMDQTGSNGNKCTLAFEKPLTNNGVTCRIWLAETKDGLPVISKHDQTVVFKNIAALQSPLSDEVINGLSFDPATPQTQPCKDGLGKWNIRISSTVSKGTYDIVCLTDSNGAYFNWSWVIIKIP